MRKITLLFAFLCASVMGWAIDWSGIDWLANSNEKYKLSISPDISDTYGGKRQDGTNLWIGFPSAAFGAMSIEPSGGAGAWKTFALSNFPNQENQFTVVCDGTTYTFDVYYVDGSTKSNPALSLNSYAETLDATAPAQTFQIVPSQNGDGAVSYESSNAEIASVSNTGLVTAVGRGTATITVSSAETETYAAASKTLTVTVTGPINWSAISWLGGSNNKYKLAISPEISDTYGGKRVESTNLWIGFPSAAFGAMSIEPSDGAGAWKTFALSNFPNEENQFTVVCDGTTYTFDVYYADGTTGGGGSGGGSTPTGICASETYESNISGYAINAKVTKGCNKYYLTLTSATEGKTLVSLSGDNMHCERYCDEGRTYQLDNYHMAASGRYTIQDGTITFTIPSVGDPQMYTPLYLKFNDSGNEHVFTGLQNIRLEPCSSEAAAACPDPDPEEIEDVNFALQSQGAVAYATSGNGGAAIDNNNGTRWESASSDPQTLIIDLGRRRIFNTFQIRWQTAYTRAFTIDVSNDGENWTTKVNETAYTGGGDNVEYEAQLGENVTARYIRFNGTERATQWGHSFFEFRVLLKGVPVLSSVGLESNTTIAKVGEYATLTPSPKDQNNGAIAADLSYTITPADAGHVTDNKYYPEKYGLATITVTATTANAEVTSNSISVWGVLSNNLAYSSNISTDNKVIGQSEVTGNATSAFYAVDGNKGSVWQACRDLNDNKTNAIFTSYFTLDLGNVYAVNLIAIWFDGAASDEYNIAFSKDNSTWETGFSISQSVGNYTHQKYLSLTDLNNNDQVRYVRFTTEKASTTSGWGMKMFEMEVYGTEASTAKTVSATVSPASTGSVLITTGNPAVEVTEPVESGTSVTFTATPAEGYDFVNWTLGGVEVSTNPEYAMEITANTALVANFELHRNTYCRTVVKTNDNKTLYLSCSKVADNTYQIRVDGSAEARINGRNNFNFVINNTNDYSNESYSNETGHGWLVSNEGYGYIVNTFSANDYKTLSFGSHYFAIGAQGGGEFILDNNFPAANTIAWNSTCADETAPVMAAPTVAALNTTDVRLTLSATDNWEGIITYNINYKPTGAEGDGTNVETTGASGETVTYDIEGLTTNTGYTFTVTAKDAANNVCAAQSCTATPAGDVAAPTNVSITAVALTNTIVRLTLSADDDYAGNLTYNITYDNAGAASTSAAQGTSTTLDITGLTANTEYHFSVTATDAANNISAAVNAPAVRTYAANLALNQPCEAGAIDLPKAESNDGNKGSRWASGGSAVHGNDVSTSQDWWYVDLGAVYDIKNIRMYWEGACPSKYKFFTSNDATNWTEIANILVSPEYSADASKVMDYLNDIDANAQGRYLKVWGYEDTNNNWAYGISFWELEAYGTLATDVTAPVISEFTATGASTTSVVLKATATDNFNGDLTYTFYCNDVALADPVVKASGVEATYVVNELSMGTNYNFKVNVSDGVNSTMSDVVVGSPINDAQAPADVTVTSVATHNSITLTLRATDNLGGMIYYTVTCGETVKEAQAVSGESVEVTFDGLDYSTPYAFSIVAKDGSNNEAEPVAHNKTTSWAPYPTSAAPAPAFAEASVRPVFSSAYNKDCNFYDWGGSGVAKQTYGAKKLNHEAAYFGIADFGTIKVDADDELYLSVWTNEDISFRVVPIINNTQGEGNLPERGAYTQTLTGGQWNVVHFTMSEFNLDGNTPAQGYDNFDEVYQIKIDRADNQTFWLDNIYFRRKGALSDEGSNADFITANANEGQDVVLNRTILTNDGWYTLCVPFDMDADKVVEVFGSSTIAEMTGAEDRGTLIHLNFDYVNAIEAGHPYLIKPGMDYTAGDVIPGVTIKNVTPIVAGNDLMHFQGVYNATTLTEENIRFVADDDYLYSPAVGGTEMGAFRCYFTIPDASPALAPGKRAKIVMGPQTATGISNVQGDYVQCTKVLKNGQLLIIRDGRTYSAQGIMVKSE